MVKKNVEIEDVKESIKALEEQVKILIENLKPKEVAPESVVSAPIVENPTNQQFPIPLEYREVIDLILNKKFGIEITYMGDVAAFDLSIMVPREYSNAGEPHWQTNRQDRRSKVIQNAYGSNGVREWAQKVYDNFSNETKAKITFDRGQPQ